MVAWNLLNQLILHPQACASFPPLSLLYRRRSKIWSIQGFPALQWQSWKQVWSPASQHHNTIPRSISSLPPLSPSEGFQPSGATFQGHRGSLQSSVDTRMGSLKGGTGCWLASCPPCRAHHPLTFISALEIDLLHSPSPSPSSASLSLTYSVHTRPGGAFLLPSVAFEIGLNSL